MADSPAMPRFTFSAGNARALARAPLYAIGALVARLVRRDPGRWVMASGLGLGEGALALWQHTRDLDPERRLTWLASSAEELAAAREAGMTALPARGWSGFLATLRAGAVVVTHGLGDVNRYGSSGAVVVQLWHGIPLKRMHLDTDAALRLPLVGSLPGARALMSALYRRGGARITLFPVASELVAARIRSAFALGPDRVRVLGDPRDDVLLRGTAEERRHAARSRIEAAAGALPSTARLVLYAPTWRDGEVDPAIPDAAQWKTIAAWAEKSNVVLLVRSHPLGAGSYVDGPASSARIRLLGREQLLDVTPALPALDALLTDYSSIAFDAAIAGVPNVFLAPDLAAYLASRGLYTPYRAFSGGDPATTWVTALDRVEAVLTPGPARETALAHARWLRDEHVDLLDGRATERVYTALCSLLGETSPGSAVPDAPPPRPVTISSIALDEERLELRGTAEAPVSALSLVGSRGRLPAAIEQHGREWVAVVPLRTSRWGAVSRLPPPSGEYQLEIALDGMPRPTTRATVAFPVPAEVRGARAHISVRADAGTLIVTTTAPLADDERGPAAQRRLESQYRSRRAQPETAVMFESFYAQSAACNPLALDRELARVRPDVIRYWSVVDRSVVVPEGAVPLVEGSAEWWRVRADARLLIVNDWLRKRWRPRPHQRVLQTWHGTMLKRLALDREGVGLRTRIAITRESRRWSILLAQNPWAAEVLRRAYAYRGPVWVEGYPRNDLLLTGERESVRARLGLHPHQRAVLYAPTWRDDRREIVDYLDLPGFAVELAALPGDHVLLVRGHSRTLRFGHDLDAPGLIDVTSYPAVNELLLAADVLVTDYSSVMFDVTAATGTPLVLFVPDLEHYRRDLRGFYFDVTAEAPGPVVRDRDALLAALANLADLTAGAPASAASAEGRDTAPPALAAWRARFNPLDDGFAAKRVVDRILAEGLLD